MNEEIKFALEYLKNMANGDVLAPRHIQNIEEYIKNLIYCISHNNLQSKIDKANKILDKHFQDDEGIVYKITGEYVAERNEKFIEELRDILKENRI